MFNRLVNFLDKHNTLNENQFGLEQWTLHYSGFFAYH